MLSYLLHVQGAAVVGIFAAVSIFCQPSVITAPQSLDRNWGYMLVSWSLWGQTQAAAVLQKFLLVALPSLRSVPGLVYFVALLHTGFPWVTCGLESGAPSLSLCFPCRSTTQCVAQSRSPSHSEAVSCEPKALTKQKGSQAFGVPLLISATWVLHPPPSS